MAEIYEFRARRSTRHSTNLDVALSYARAGFAIFPASSRTKVPLIDEWPTAATSDRVTVRNWWREHPNAAVGLPTGSRNGIAVLDLDQKNGKDGAATLDALGIDVSSHVSVETPSGGQHLIFDFEDGIRNTESRLPNGDRAPGVDVRGEGGYIIAPGSQLVDGRAYKYSSRATLIDDVIGRPSWPKELAPASRQYDGCEHRADTHTTLTLTDGREIIEELPIWWADGRDQWRNTGMALKHYFGDEALELWDQWSQRCLEKYDRPKLVRQWRSFKSSARNPITMASLIRGSAGVARAAARQRNSGCY